MSRSQGVAPRPRVPWGGPKGVQKGPASTGEAFARGATALLILTNTTWAVCTAVLVVALTRRPALRVVRGWWVAVAGAVGVVVAVPAHGGRAYLAPWRDVLYLGRRALLAKTSPGPVLEKLVAARWSSWVQQQLPVAVCLALLVAGCYVARRQRYAAPWREQDGPRWGALSERRTRKATARVTGDGARAQVGTSFTSCVMPMGITPAGETASLSGASLAGHATVTGPTGTGKTTTLLRLAYGVLVDWQPLRLPLVMFDFKADPRVRDALAGMAARTGRRFHLVSVTDRTEAYNPIREGSAEEVAARLIETMSNAEDGGFSEPHHRTVGERWLIMAAKVLDDLIEQRAMHRPHGTSEPWRRTIEDLAAVMRPDEIAAQLPNLSAAVCRRAKGLLDELKAEKDLQRSILGMRSRVALMAETSAGAVMTEAPDGLILAHAIEAGDVVLFSLSAAANPAASRVVGNMAIGDLGAQFDALLRAKWAERTGRRVVVMLDEFSGLGGSALQSLFERARGGGGALITSTQVDANYTDVSDSFGESVWGNSNVWLLHRQPGESAEKRAEGIGTAPAWMETVQVTEDADPLGSTTGGTGVGTARCGRWSGSGSIPTS